MRLALLLLCGSLCGQVVIDPAVEFTDAALSTLKPGGAVTAGVFGRTLQVWPHVDPVRVYVAFEPIPAAGAPRVPWPFMLDPRLEVFPRIPTPFGDWRLSWPTIKVNVPPTPGPLLFQEIALPIPPGHHAVQLCVVDAVGKAAVSGLMAIP